MKCSIAITSIVLALAVCPLCAGGSAPLADRLPAGTLVYAGWAGQSLTFRGSMFGQMLKDPLFEQFVETLKQASLDKASDANAREMAAEGWELAGMLFRHPTAVAMFDIGDANNDGPPSVALLVDLGEDRAKFAEHLDSLLAARTKPPTLV